MLKIDTCTSATLKERYARICIQIPLEVSVKTKVTIGTHTQKVVNEGEGVLCTACGRIGHIAKYCTQVKPPDPPHTSASQLPTTKENEGGGEEWQLVMFPKRK